MTAPSRSRRHRGAGAGRDPRHPLCRADGCHHPDLDYIDRSLQPDRDLWRIGEAELHRDRVRRRRRRRYLLRSFDRPVVAAVQRHHQRTERRQRHRYRDPRRRQPARRFRQPLQSLRPRGSQCAQSTQRPAGDRRADQRLPVDDGLYEFVVRSVERRRRQSDRRRRAGFCAGAGRKPAVGYRASLQFRAPKRRRRNKPSISAGAPGARPWRRRKTRRQSGGRLRRRHGKRLRLRRRHGLPRHAGFSLRLCARRRRHQLERGGKSRHRAERQLPGRRPRHHALGAVLSVRRAGFRQSLVHHQPHRGRRPSHRQIRRPELRGARRSRLPLRRAGHRPDHRRDALCGVAGAGLPHAGLFRNRSHRRRAWD